MQAGRQGERDRARSVIENFMGLSGLNYNAGMNPLLRTHLRGHRPAPWPLLCLLTLTLLSCARAPEWHGTDISGVMPDLAFELVDSSGATVTEAAFRGRPVLLFFGFTHCPGPCPTTLARVGLALESLGATDGRLSVIMASVDPERDTPEAMARFEQAFGPWLHGLTGNAAALEPLRLQYKVHAQRLLAESGEDYDVSHGTQVFGFDRQGRVRLLWSDVANTDALAADLERLLHDDL